MQGQRGCGRRLASAARAVSLAAAAALAACGGEHEPATSVGPPTGEVAQATAALKRYQQERAYIESHAGLYRQAAGQARPVSCFEQLHRALARPAGMEPTSSPPSLACLAGTYTGRTLAGRECVVRIDAVGSSYRFERSRADGIALVPDPAPDATTAHRFARADTEHGQLGLQWQREQRAPGGDAVAAVETLVVTAATGENGRDELRSVTYERSAGRRTEIVRCGFAE